MSVLATLDWVIILLYFVLILGIAWWVIRQKNNTSDDYFLAGRNLGWFVIGSSIFASNIGSEHIVGLAGSGATDGVAMAHYELHAWCLLVLGWVLAPFYMRSKIYTMPEFLEKRFSPASRWVLSIISLIAYVLTKVAVGIFAGGIVFGVLLPDVNFMGLDSFWVGSILMILLTGAYTILGGLKAVAYTEAIQTVILIFGAVTVTVYGLDAIGGWEELKRIAGSEMFNLWKPLVPEGVEGTWAPVKTETRMAWYFNTNYPWVGMLFCAPIIGLWYWCTDQYIVQRMLGAANLTEARRGTIAAAFFKLLPVFIFIIPGIITFALAASGKMPQLAENLLDADGNIINANAQQVFPMLVAKVLPAGIRGLVVAGLLAALMSSLAGVFNASSTLFTMDLYSKFRPNVSEAQLVRVGRIATAVMVVIGLLWIPVIQGSRGLYDYLQSVQGYLAPPIFVVFFFGVFNQRLNANGALAAMLVGFALGLFRLMIDTPVMLNEGFAYAEGSFFWIMNNMFFQYYSLLIFLVSAITMVAVSYATAPPPAVKVDGLTVSTVSAEQRAETRSSVRTIDIIFSVLVIVLILVAYLYFTG
ncbi:SSS family solute:Na+ symporter [Lewinella marina]|uniref:Na+/glucose cotransporter n=1 Tax=Neolewinella marina TaxID=438751 RepID=A0A2G0CB04_9BACT|nr:sodium:solute symporter [Neolewinella marina]NJB84272.1 SSS family solute:Na+ symporter [Neolewinella marina]PHK97144.1 Na+/glucose cotransporter [Neolewinella marina]